VSVELSSQKPRVCIQAEDFDLGAAVAELSDGDSGVGAVVSFVGVVRGGDREGGADALELEHYPGMTERSIEAMVAVARERFSILGALVIHRVGRLAVGEQIVLVAVSSAHRGIAFQACEFLMDYLKTQAPFWKKEFTSSGARWVDARVSDDAALARWGLDSANAPASAEEQA
jgi:molybdopterin synthase catalytic subunit